MTVSAGRAARNKGAPHTSGGKVPSLSCAAVKGAAEFAWGVGVGVTLSSRERASAKRELLVLSASVGIGRQSLDLGVAFGKRSVLAREFEETGLKVGLSGVRRRAIFEASRVVFDCEWPYQHRVRCCCGREHELTARKLPSRSLWLAIKNGASLDLDTVRRTIEGLMITPHQETEDNRAQHRDD